MEVTCHILHVPCSPRMEVAPLQALGTSLCGLLHPVRAVSALLSKRWAAHRPFTKGALVSLGGWARVGAWPACLRSCSPSPLHTLVLSGVFTDVEASLKDIRDLLEEDELLDQKFQEAVGQAGANMAVSKAELAEVRREWAKYMEVHEKASFTNSELHRAMNLHVGNLRLLSGPLDQVRAALPTPALTPGEPRQSCAPVLKRRAGGPSGLTDHCCPQRTRPCCRT